jgi:RNA polymerase sigma factor (sigma-70 family)
MDAGPDPRLASNPLLAGPSAWDELIEAVNPPIMLMRIEGRMGEALRRFLSPEDIWQEALLHAWRDRERCQWQGVASFRRWLIQIAVNRIHDAVDRQNAGKRGGGAAAVEPGGSRGASSQGFPFALQSTTPSRVAWHKEQAAAMREALDSLPELVREVVRLRLFEERAPDEIAAELGISAAAFKHRLRQGCALYRERLAAKLALRASTFPRGP